MHIPVLLHETIAALDLHPGDFAIDGTVDGGGHAAAILERIGDQGKLLGLDLDPELLAKCKARIANRPNVVLRQGNYVDLPEILTKENLRKADALLLDLGFSSEQMEREGRGLSFASDAPLAMTYDPAATPFYETLRKLSEDEIAEILQELGEERYAKRIAKAICARERQKPILTTRELAELVAETVPKNYERGRLNPATRAFQAFRIYANDELGNLHHLLERLGDVLAPGGRIAIISFHSLEDRIVKNCFRDLSRDGKLEIITKKPITATEQELNLNPRARNAKLRVANLT